MSTRIVSQTVTIMEKIAFPMSTPLRVRHDLPRNIEETMALEKLKSETQGWVASDDDYIYLRFLRARNHNVEKAKEMLRKYLDFRKNNTYLLEVTNSSYKPHPYIMEQLIARQTGHDFDGRPVWIIALGKLNFKSIFDMGLKDDFIQFGHYLLEIVQNSAETARRKSGCTKVIGVLDLDGFSFTSAFHVQTIQTALYAAKIFEANYPESLHTCIAINTNWISASLYNVAKPVLSADTCEKIQIYGYDSTKWKAALRKNIPEESIPIDYGGTGPKLISGLHLNPSGVTRL